LICFELIIRKSSDYYNLTLNIMYYVCMCYFRNICFYENKALTVMVNNSTNINKMNNYLSDQTIKNI